MSNQVTISKERLIELLTSEQQMTALNSCGIDTLGVYDNAKWEYIEYFNRENDSECSSFEEIAAFIYERGEDL